MSHEQSQSQPSRTRARLVCLQCHIRKLKCDLESRKHHGHESCRKCAEGAIDCQPRPPKRRKGNPEVVQDGPVTTTLQKITYAPIQPAIRDQLLQVDTSTLQDCHFDAPFEDILPATQQPIINGDVVEEFITKRPISLALPHPSNASNPTATSEKPNQAGPPSNQSHPPAIGYLETSGILNLFEPDYRGIATVEPERSIEPNSSEKELPPPELQQSFAETYFEYCWPWCPVLDKTAFWDSLDNSPSPLLLNAMALLGTQTRPPITQHANPSEYYNRAKMMFYMDHEQNPIVCLQAIMLFYWWAPRGPNVVHKDAAWWWTGIAIKYAQQMGLHREPKDVQDVGGVDMQGLRRRIWWTLFARERLTAMCQGRPLTINPEDCTVREPSLADFGSLPDTRAHVFIYWVQLCGIIGRIGQDLSRQADRISFPVQLAQDLISWVEGLPPSLNLPDRPNRARKFDRDLLKLHLPYLTTVTILHLNWSSQHPDQPWPETYTAAILSASCVTRIFRDLLARGEIRFLGAIACWYVGVAIVALMHTQRVQILAESGAQDIRILRLALNELANLWPSTAIFVKGFERLRAFEGLEVIRDATQRSVAEMPLTNSNTATSSLPDPDWSHGIGWQSYFPHVTSTTSGLASILLADSQSDIWGDASWLSDSFLQMQDLFESSDVITDPYLENLSSLCWSGDQSRF